MLAEIAISQPHAQLPLLRSPSVMYTSSRHTVPDIEPHLLALAEELIRSHLIPALTGRCSPSDSSYTRELLSLPPRLVGLGLINHDKFSLSQYQVSTSITKQLKNPEYSLDCIRAKSEAHKHNNNSAKDASTAERSTLQSTLQRAMDLAQERGASSCTMAWIRCCLCFCLLRSSIQCL